MGGHLSTLLFADSILFSFILESGGEILLQTEYFCAKPGFIMLGISARLSKVQLGPPHPYTELFCIPFVAFTELL